MDEKTDWDLRLGYLIHDVSRLRRMMFDRALAPLGITRSQWWVLAFISRKDGLPQTQLANELDVGKVALGALIDRLESAGFVARRADPIDRRVKRVFLTKQAGRFLRRIRGETDVFNAKIVSGIRPRCSRKDLRHVVRHETASARHGGWRFVVRRGLTKMNSTKSRSCEN